jgi:DNA-binding FrmR family transcriptional regulator
MNQNTKTESVGKHFILSDTEKQKLVTNINKIIGQLESIKRDISQNEACDESLTQILSIKGGVEKIGRELVGKGILECLTDYSTSELEVIIKNLFKLS